MVYTTMTIITETSAKLSMVIIEHEVDSMVHAIHSEFVNAL